MATNPNVLYSGDFWTGFAQTPTPTPIVVTFSFPTSLPSFDDNPPNGGFTQATINSFTPFTAAEQTQAINALSEWATASQIIFVQVAPGQGDINFSNVNFTTLTTHSSSTPDAAGIGYNPFGEWNSFSKPYFTTDNSVAGSIFMNSETGYQNADGTVAYDTLLHEIGHAIGLKHPGQMDDDPSTGIDEDNMAPNDPNLTIMATTGDAKGSGTGHLKALDIAAAASIYGQPTGGAPGTATGSGEVIAPTVIGGVTSYIAQTWDPSSTSAPVQTAFTGGGANSVSTWTWDPSTQTLTQTAATANDVIHGTSVNDVINAGNGMDSLFGLDGNNTLYGGTLSTSNDTFYGGPNADTMYGGALVDNTFVAGAGTYTFFAGGGTESMVGGGSASTNTFYDGTYDNFGSGGTDYMVGDGATDKFYVGGPKTTVTENNPDSDATLYTTVSYTLPQHVDTLYLFAAGLTGTGNNDANISMFGSGTGANTLIAGTGADYMVGGSGNDTLIAGSGNDSMYGQIGDNTFVFKSVADTNSYIGDFNLGTDTIDLTGIAKTFGNPLTFIDDAGFTSTGQVQTVVDPFNSSYIDVNVDTAASGVVDFQIVVNNNGAALTASDFDLACYCAGTRIMTDRGEVAVEGLSIGDRVTTVNGVTRPVKWIGQRAYAGRFANGNQKTLPVCFKAGSLADGLPKRDLWVSPNHAMYIDGILIQAEDLVNGDNVVQSATVEIVRYFHIELESHDVILAEGAWSETFIDDGSRMMFHNADDYFRRYPEQVDGPPRYCAPRVNEGFTLQVIRERIHARAGARLAHAV
jgi:Ca2+-binding RTX toxin-like protein